MRHSVRTDLPFEVLLRKIYGCSHQTLEFPSLHQLKKAALWEQYKFSSEGLSGGGGCWNERVPPLGRARQKRTTCSRQAPTRKPGTHTWAEAAWDKGVGGPAQNTALGCLKGRQGVVRGGPGTALGGRGWGSHLKVGGGHPNGRLCTHARYIRPFSATTGYAINVSRTHTSDSTSSSATALPKRLQQPDWPPNRTGKERTLLSTNFSSTQPVRENGASGNSTETSAPGAPSRGRAPGPGIQTEIPR